MPTFTSIALESLIEPRFRDSYKDSAKKTVKSMKDDDDKEVREEEVRSRVGTE